MNNIWKYIISLIIGLIIGIFILRCNVSPIEIPIEVHDTVTVETERIIEKTKVINTTDTLVKVDSIIQEKDGTFVSLPMEWKHYHDVFKNDSSKLTLDIDYHGILSNIDSISYTYDYSSTVRFLELKKIEPFIMFQAGPLLNYDFRKISGVGMEIGAGIISSKTGWGGLVSYELSAGQLIQHELKVGFIKKF